MKIQCNHFPDTLVSEATKDAEAVYEKSCRFYALEEDREGKRTGTRWKVHVDGEVDFDAVAAEFVAKGCPEPPSAEALRLAHAGE